VKGYVQSVDGLLLDAWSPDQLGGTGQRLPLDWLADTTLPLPWWLAGGISAEWIPELLDRVTPDGLDASSRLEVRPGWKDLEKVNALLSAVQA
jgi:phosphoribosylanthranilate isomerase